MPYHHTKTRHSIWSIKESQRMRLACIMQGVTPAMVSEACGCSVRHAGKWFSENTNLATEYQCRLQMKYPNLGPTCPATL